MKIVSAHAAPLRLTLRRPVVTAHGTLRVREGFRVALCDGDGRVGRGECMPLPGFGTETREAAGRALEQALPRLDAVDPGAPGELPPAAATALEATPTARAALDTALHDLASQAAELPLACWLAQRAGRRAHAAVPASRLLAATDPDALLEEARRAVASGFAALKLKVGVESAARDGARVAAARRGAGREVALGLDANGAWSAEEALQRIEAWSVHDLAWVEQPVPARDLAGLAFVRRRAGVAIAADESVLRLADARRVLDAGAADRLVLKPAALGGIAAADVLAKLARAAGVELAVTSLLDGALGLHAALHFAASLPGPLLPCGLATGDLLADDALAPPRSRQGVLPLPTAPGLGVTSAGGSA